MVIFIRDAVRLATSEDTLAPFNDDTIQSLRLLHPACHCYGNVLPSPSIERTIQLDDYDIIAGIQSLPAGSSNGLDGIRPQHLKDLTCAITGNSGRLLFFFTNFGNHCLSGHIPSAIKSLFCGASLYALNKKNGDIHPIAVGC